MASQMWSASLKPANSVKETFTIALTMQNMEQLESKLLSVSTPGANLYGQYMDVDEVNTVFAPSDVAFSSVLAWLHSYNISDYTVDGAFIDFSADIHTADALLNASYQYYASNSVTKLRTLSYSIPDDLEQHVVLVYPGTYFGLVDVTNVGIRAAETARKGTKNVRG